MSENKNPRSKNIFNYSQINNYSSNEIENKSNFNDKINNFLINSKKNYQMKFNYLNLSNTYNRIMDEQQNKSFFQNNQEIIHLIPENSFLKVDEQTFKDYKILYKKFLEKERFMINLKNKFTPFQKFIEMKKSIKQKLLEKVKVNQFSDKSLGQMNIKKIEENYVVTNPKQIFLENSSHQNKLMSLKRIEHIYDNENNPMIDFKNYGNLKKENQFVNSIESDIKSKDTQFEKDEPLIKNDNKNSFIFNNEKENLKIINNKKDYFNYYESLKDSIFFKDYQYYKEQTDKKYFIEIQSQNENNFDDIELINHEKMDANKKCEEVQTNINSENLYKKKTILLKSNASTNTEFLQNENNSQTKDSFIKNSDYEDFPKIISSKKILERNSIDSYNSVIFKNQIKLKKLKNHIKEDWKDKIRAISNFNSLSAKKKDYNNFEDLNFNYKDKLSSNNNQRKSLNDAFINVNKTIIFNDHINHEKNYFNFRVEKNSKNSNSMINIYPNIKNIHQYRKFSQDKTNREI